MYAKVNTKTHHEDALLWIKENNLYKSRGGYLMLFISNAYAQSSGAAEPNPMFTIIMFTGLFIFMYFMIIRPQRKRQKEHNDLVNSLAKGDEVVMTSGMLGKITKIEGEYVVLEVNNNLTLKFQKASVHAVLPKGTIKAI